MSRPFSKYFHETQESETKKREGKAFMFRGLPHLSFHLQGSEKRVDRAPDFYPNPLRLQSSLNWVLVREGVEGRYNLNCLSLKF